MKKILLILMLFCGCKKDTEVTSNTSQSNDHATLVINPYGNVGDRAKYKIFCVYNPETFNYDDSTQTPNFSVYGKVGTYINLVMTRPEFFYIIEYKDSIIHYDSLYASQAGFTGWTIKPTYIRYRTVNRSQSTELTLPATIN